MIVAAVIGNRYRLIGTFVALSALLLAASLPASADVQVVRTKLTISFQAEASVFSGKLSSKDRGCVPGRPVTTKMVAPGPDKSVATTRTNSPGGWRHEADPDPGTYYAHAPATRVKVKNQTGRRCTPGRTDFFQIFPHDFGTAIVKAVGVFANGRGGCPVATSFDDEFEFSGPSTGVLMIRQPLTNDVVSGPIRPNKKFKLSSTREAYDGQIKGNTATATYSYTTARGCIETYDATFTLQR